MDRFELVEKLVKSTGVSYADAKAALEASGWDLLDAAVWLEKSRGKPVTSAPTPNNSRNSANSRKRNAERKNVPETLYAIHPHPETAGKAFFKPFSEKPEKSSWTMRSSFANGMVKFSSKYQFGFSSSCSSLRSGLL